ncbi:MAG: orotate phosphoribosyltransferase [Alphaproteobacteria bacterium GM202ARS2]|nr:orotate phosphoribosyltransferase [Alphaproteobacteria bacterium GM202ARS2]
MQSVFSDKGRASVARHLLDCGAVTVDVHKPFTWSSGRKSPIYVDCRRLLSYPAERRAVMDAAARMLAPFIDKQTLLAGGESGGIGYAAILADRLSLPMVYVRKKVKGYGLNKAIEGDTRDCRHAVLIEDQTTDGGSKGHFIEALRQAGLSCQHAFVIFSYETALLQSRMKQWGVALHCLCSYRDVMDAAVALGRLTRADVARVDEFIASLAA